MAEIDHRAEALRLLKLAGDALAANGFGTHVALTAEAQVHATLAVSAPRPDNATLAVLAQLGGQRDELREAVRAVLRNRTNADASTVSFVVPASFADRLIDLAQ